MTPSTIVGHSARERYVARAGWGRMQGGGPSGVQFPLSQIPRGGERRELVFWSRYPLDSDNPPQNC